jgi:hypothetical protein
MRTWLAANRIPLGAFVLGLVVFGGVAGDRMRRGSTDPHFVVQADAWLHGRLEITDWPAGADDPAKVDEVRLDDGRVVRGRKLQSRPTFRIAGDGEIPLARVKETLRTISYNSFPPFPSVLLIPQALVHGARANDVAFTVVVAALVPFAFLLLLRRLRAAGLSERSSGDEIWLTVLLTLGTVFFFSSVQGRVWFTAQVVGVLLAILYVHASVEARRPLVAGLFLGLAVATRPPMLLMAPLFLFEVWRCARARWLSRLILFAAPVAVIGVICAWYNYARFHELAEFGHSYLAVRQQAQMEQFGLFNFHYLQRNLGVALALLPDFLPRAPFVQISGHGLALWLTTPAFVLLLWPRVRGPWHRVLWLTVAGVAGWSLCYQNSGWIQFGYRFSLDYTVLLVVLLALSGRPFGRITKTLIVAGIVVNLFGAITFHRMDRFYKSDQAAYDCVIAN